MSKYISSVYKMRKRGLGIVLAFLLAGVSIVACGASQSAGAAPVAPVASSPTIATMSPPQHCGTIVLNPRGKPEDSAQAQKTNACFWRAYQKCLPATLSLRAGGVDTISQRTFTIEKKGTRCEVTDVVQHAIVPRPLSAAQMYSCASVTNVDDSLYFKHCGEDGDISIPDVSMQ